MGGGQDTDHRRDSDFRIEGPVVAQMQATFLDNWMKTRGQVLHGEAYSPEIKAAGESYAQMFSSPPFSRSENDQFLHGLFFS